jgi:hypothetical protein
MSKAWKTLDTQKNNFTIDISEEDLDDKETPLCPCAPPTEHHAMKAHWGVEVQLHPFFDLGTRRR